MIKKFIKTTIIAVSLVAMAAVPALAGCIVNATWTPSPNAVREILLLDGDEKACSAGQCEFIVSELVGQSVVIRSFNTQGGYVDYEAVTLDKETLPAPASNFNITILCTE